jgi:hypothetical protein
LKVRLLLAECYANTCFAKVVANILGSKSKLYHTPKMGRDRVLKKPQESLAESMKEMKRYSLSWITREALIGNT